ncbi:GntR family transcriptional regulator, partial [Victivallis vadensis]
MPTVAKPVKYRQIYEELSHRIRCGALKPGEQLPSTQELAEYYST